VITVSSLRQSAKKMTKLSANSYLHKPSEYQEFMKLGDIVKDLLGP
jgi:hypothetical protein